MKSIEIRLVTGRQRVHITAVEALSTVKRFITANEHN